MRWNSPRWSNDHRSHASQNVEMEPTVKMGHASAAIARRAEREQITSCKELHAIGPRGQMNETIQKARGWVYLDHRPEWLHEMGALLRKRAELAAPAWQGWRRVRRERCGRGCKPTPATGSRQCLGSTIHPGRSRCRGSSWTSRGRGNAIGSASENDSADLTGQISGEGGSVRSEPRFRQRSGAAHG